MVRSVIDILHEQIAAVCPITGISLGDLNNKATWRVDYASSATQAQRDAAAAVVTGFDVGSVQSAQDAEKSALATLTAGSQAHITYMSNKQSTGPQMTSTVDGIFSKLDPGDKTIVGFLLRVVVTLLRRETP